MSFSDRDSDYPDRQMLGWIVPLSAKTPGAILCVIMAAVWVIYLISFGSMSSWAVSAEAIREGRYETLFLHMFAHGGFLHIAMNLTVLFDVSGPLVARMGSWIRLAALYLLSGLFGVAFYLFVHPNGSVPMLGASGAISGLIGLFVRLDHNDGHVIRLKSQQVFRAGKDFVKENLWLIALLTLPALLSGRGGGVAWEAHLGGFLFGLICGPKLLPSSNPVRLINQDDASGVTATM